MPATAKPQTPALLGVAASTYMTVTAGTVGNVKEIILCNVTGNARSVYVFFCPSSVTVASSNMVIDAVSIASGTTVRFPFNTFLEAGGTVQAYASLANAISIRVSSVEFS